MRGKNATERVPADAGGIARAARILDEGGLVAVPTETVYGLAARADNPAAIARIYEAKGRPSFNPLIVHVAGIAAAQRLARLDEAALALAERYWPGPLTLVCPMRGDAGLAPAVSAGLPTLALRQPAHPAFAALLEAVEFPLAAPRFRRICRTCRLESCCRLRKLAPRRCKVVLEFFGVPHLLLLLRLCLL